MADENKPINTEVNLHKRVCPYCKQEIQIKIGLGNWKNLFRRPTLDDWIVLIILIFILFAAYAYNLDTKTCRETLNNIDEICVQVSRNLSLMQNISDKEDINFTLFKELFNNTNT